MSTFQVGGTIEASGIVEKRRLAYDCPKAHLIIRHERIDVRSTGAMDARTHPSGQRERAAAEHDAFDVDDEDGRVDASLRFPAQPTGDETRRRKNPFAESIVRAPELRRIDGTPV